MAHDPVRGTGGSDPNARHYGTMRGTMARSGIRARKWDALGNDTRGSRNSAADAYDREHRADGQGVKTISARTRTFSDNVGGTVPRK
jgi:hypothetical protein